MKITSQYLRARLVDLGVDAKFIQNTDNAYFCPSLEWLRGDFSEACFEAFKDREYTVEANDCDDFAVTAMALARRGNMQRRGAREGIAFGLVDLFIDAATTINGVAGPGRHETNLVLCTVPDGPEPVWFLFEPQNRNVSKWTDYAPMDLSPDNVRF